MFLTIVQDSDRNKWIGDVTIKTAGAQAQAERLGWLEDKIFKNVNTPWHGTSIAKCK